MMSHSVGFYEAYIMVFRCALVRGCAKSVSCDTKCDCMFYSQNDLCLR